MDSERRDCNNTMPKARPWIDTISNRLWQNTGLYVACGLAFVLSSFLLLIFNIHADDAPEEMSKNQIAAPVVQKSQILPISDEVYITTILKDSYLPNPRLRIYRMAGTALIEVYEQTGAGKELLELSIGDVTGDGIPEVLSTWRGGQEGLKSLSVIQWDSDLKSFKEVLTYDSARKIELVQKKHGKSVGTEICIDCDTRKGKLYSWRNSRFVVKSLDRAAKHKTL
jgi:hypothetical protein